ncbi:MAG: hypothetical protein DMG43_01640 [Acidobacteria bacterium]|nr:MAG: hypothetical protein DMG43_01640 [Acidobacteriota bacterium]
MKKYPGPKLLLLVCLLLLPLGFAVGKLRSQEKTPAAPHATLADFSWLAGRWEGNLGNVTAEQTWIPARNGTMQGMFRLTDTEKTIVVELFTIRETTDGVFFYLRHFSPELVPQEKEDAYRMKLAKSDSTHFQFDNTVHNELQHAILTLLDVDHYTAHADLIGNNGQPRVIEVAYRRVK